MTSRETDAILGVARQDHDHAAHLLEQHQRACILDSCPDCEPLLAHYARTSRQVALPGDAGTETEALF